jgi:tRNA pseudouridine65 synthase
MDADKSPEFKILHLDEDFVAIEKPQGFHVHQPEFPRRRVSRGITVLPNLRDQLGLYLYPVHRIDVGTEGVLIFAFKKETAAYFSRLFQNGGIHKLYFAVVRGWMDPDGTIDIPLELDSTDIAVPALTRFRTHGRVELPFAVGKKHQTARYSLVEARPETGRYHQVRRHFARLAHPLVGDRVHGDSHHNRFFRETLAEPGLWLKAKGISFAHPVTGDKVLIDSAWSDRWNRVFKRFDLPAPQSDWQGQ